LKRNIRDSDKKRFGSQLHGAAMKSPGLAESDRKFFTDRNPKSPGSMPRSSTGNKRGVLERLYHSVMQERDGKGSDTDDDDTLLCFPDGE
jgi:hypothetical protein